MKSKKYISPKIIINKVYTKAGDSGTTYIVGGKKVSKSDIRVRSFGEIDELNVAIGSCCVLIESMSANKDFSKLLKELNNIQHELFNLGNMIATPLENYTETMPSIQKQDVQSIELKIDYYNVMLESLNSFVLPGGSELNIRFNKSRTICRRCERTIVELALKEDINKLIIAYLNRLSDLLFVLSRWANKMLKKNEFLWNPNFNE